MEQRNKIYCHDTSKNIDDSVMMSVATKSYARRQALITVLLGWLSGILLIICMAILLLAVMYEVPRLPYFAAFGVLVAGIAFSLTFLKGASDES